MSKKPLVRNWMREAYAAKDETLKESVSPKVYAAIEEDAKARKALAKPKAKKNVDSKSDKK